MAQRTLSIVIEVSGTENALRQVRQMRSALDDLGGGGQQNLGQVVRQSREASQALKEMQKSFSLREQQRQIVGDLDDFFRRILTGAHSARDVFKNLWKEVAESFRRAIQEMAETWAVQLGGLIPLPGGTLGGLGSFGSLGRMGIGPFSGSQVGWGGATLAGLTIGNTNRVLSALGGLGGGALMGFSVAGPIGAAVGGLIGGLAGLFTGGGGKAKERDAAVANQGFAQLAQIVDDYSHFRRDFASAVEAANRIWSQMQSQWARPQSAASQRPYFDSILRSLQATEDERNRRRQLMGALAVPEFHEGGLVSPQRTQRGTLAMLQAGEYVMSSQAVQRLGVSLLEGLNRGSEPRPSGSGGGLLVDVAPASREWFLKSLEEGIPIVVTRGGRASKILRG